MRARKTARIKAENNACVTGPVESSHVSCAMAGTKHTNAHVYSCLFVLSCVCIQ